MTAREEILSNIRKALNRKENEAPPPVLLRQAPEENLLEQFTKALEALAGHVVVVKNADVQTAVDRIVDGRTVEGDISKIDVGITSADYALADTGSLVIFADQERLRSLLPPCHIAVIGRSKIVASLDDVLRLHPLPGEKSSATIVITGPSRTADIEMRLVRGVHGPGEIHAVIIDDM